MTRRLKRFYLSADAVLDVFRRGVCPQNGYISVLDQWPFPAGEIIAVDWSFERQAFGVLVANPGFDEVPEGDMIPGDVGPRPLWRMVRIDDGPPDLPTYVS